MYIVLKDYLDSNNNLLFACPFDLYAAQLSHPLDPLNNSLRHRSIEQFPIVSPKMDLKVFLIELEVIV